MTQEGPPKCYHCHQIITFDDQHIGRNGKKIPLDPFTKQPHDCPMREKTKFAEEQPTGGFNSNKDDHGNEDVSGFIPTVMDMDQPNQKFDSVKPVYRNTFTSIPVAGEKPIVSPPRFNVEKLPFVDHTAKGTPQFKVFSHTSADILTIEGNEWIKTHKDQYQVKLIGQLQFDNGTFAIALYYEETK
jgi:hypothetical protein